MALQGYEFRTMMDEGRYFRLIELNDGWRNYDPTQGDAGWTTGKVADYEIGSRFLMVKLVRSVRNASNGKSYELMEVIFDKDLEKSEEEQVVYMWGIVEDRQYVQSEYPDLKEEKKKDINVVTLQLWLKMLGFDPGQAIGNLDSKTKTIFNKCKEDKLNKCISDLKKQKTDELNKRLSEGKISQEQFKELERIDIENPPKVLVGRDSWYVIDDLLKKGSPTPINPKNLFPFPHDVGYEDENDYQRFLAIGLRYFGFPVFTGEFDIDDLETLYKNLKTNMSDKAFRSRLIENNKKAVKLYKAISFDIYSYEDKNGINMYPTAITDKLENTNVNKKAWENFPTTWGWFYGAPWKGIMIYPAFDMKPGEFNWGTFETISMLEKWGMKYLYLNLDPNELSERLKNPIKIRLISNRLGGRISGLDRFIPIMDKKKLNMVSQTGQAAELNLDDYSKERQIEMINAFHEFPSEYLIRHCNNVLHNEFKNEKYDASEKGGDFVEKPKLVRNFAKTSIAMCHQFLGIKGGIYEVTASMMYVHDENDYTPPDSQTEAHKKKYGQYRGSSTPDGLKYSLKPGDRIKIEEIVLQIEDGFETRKPYEIVKGIILSSPVPEVQNDIKNKIKRLFWIVYEGNEKVRRVDINSVYVLDCGAWLTKLRRKSETNPKESIRTFGVISGNYIFLGRITTNKLAVKQWPDKMHNLLWKFLTPDNSSRDWNLEVLDYARDPNKFCSEKELYVVIPDMHICLPGDPANMFMLDGNNLENLSQFLAFSKNLSIDDNKVTLVQTGDLFDIWMAEAKKEIYYDYENVSGGHINCRKREERLGKAAEEIAKGIIADKTGLKEVIQMFDFYWPGNHDHEIWMEDGLQGILVNSENSDDKKNKIKNKIKNDKLVAINNCKFRVLHGHFFDKCNNTYIDDLNKNRENRNKYCELMMTLLKTSLLKIKDYRAKSLTFSYARYIREETIETRTEWDDQKDDYVYVRIRDEFDTNNYPRQSVANFGENWNFDTLREKIVNYIAETLKKCNPDRSFNPDSADGLYKDDLEDTYREISWEGDKLKPPSPLKDSNGEYHAIVHSHTHLPMLTKVTIKREI